MHLCFVHLDNHPVNPWRAATATGTQRQAVLHETFYVQRQKILIRIYRNPGRILQRIFILCEAKRQLHPAGGGAGAFPRNTLYACILRKTFKRRKIVFRIAAIQYISWVNRAHAMRPDSRQYCFPCFRQTIWSAPEDKGMRAVIAIFLMAGNRKVCIPVPIEISGYAP